MQLRRSAVALASASLLVGACATAVATGPTDRGSTSSSVVGPESVQNASVVWSEVVSTPGCFFFAGPGELGRDDPYGEAAEIHLRGGSLGIMFSEATLFEGAVSEGSFHLARSATYDAGGPWRVKESLDGRVEGDSYVGRYAYEECDLEGDQGCPGRCTIGASFRIVPTSPAVAYVPREVP